MHVVDEIVGHQLKSVLNRRILFYYKKEVSDNSSKLSLTSLECNSLTPFPESLHFLKHACRRRTSQTLTKNVLNRIILFFYYKTEVDKLCLETSTSLVCIFFNSCLFQNHCIA